MVVNIPKWTQLFYHFFWLFVSISYRNRIQCRREQFVWLICSCCNKPSGRWRPIWRTGWVEGFKRWIDERQKPLRTDWTRQWTRAVKSQLEAQRFDRFAEVRAKYFNSANRVHINSHNEPGLPRILFRTVLSVHLLKVKGIRCYEPFIGHTHAFQRVRIWVDFVGNQIHERFLQQWTRRIKTEAAHRRRWSCWSASELSLWTANWDFFHKENLLIRIFVTF